MKLNIARLTRLFTGVLLPVPLFIAIFCFSYFYKSYQGYDFESRTYLTDAMSLSNSRKHMWTDMTAFLFFGYIYMLIRSVLYSISLEFYKARSFSSYIGYVTLGGTLGGLSSVLYIWLNPGCFVTDVLDAFTAFILSVFIGAALPILLSFMGHPKLKREPRD
jgi:hypothetical protein